MNPDDLASQLKALRKLADLSQAELADLIGVSRHTISKVETGERGTNADNIRSWVQACGGTKPQAERLARGMVEARTIVTTWTERMSDGQAVVQQDYIDLIAASETIVYVELNLIPGPLQTQPYARRQIELNARRHQRNETPEAISEAAATRIRAGHWLADPTKQWEFVIWEPALYEPYIDGQGMRAQLDRVASFIGYDHVTVRIAPQQRAVTERISNPFQMYDDEVMVDTSSKSLRDPDAALYRRVLELIRPDTVTGGEALKLIRKAARQFR